jgi:biopolymer transport protein ExbD
MPIKVPGKRNRHGGVGSSKRDAVAVLQLTAMVDMFTVMCVFLLQNYATTNQVLPIDESVVLPQAKEVKDLKPSNVVVVSENGIMLNSTKVAEFRTVKEQEDWTIKPLEEGLKKFIEDGEKAKKTKGLGATLRSAVSDKKDEKVDTVDDFRKMTVQADKTMDFLTVKKVMYTVTEAGIQEINFAVLKKPGETTQ